MPPVPPMAELEGDGSFLPALAFRQKADMGQLPKIQQCLLCKKAWNSACIVTIENVCSSVMTVSFYKQGDWQVRGGLENQSSWKFRLCSKRAGTVPAHLPQNLKPLPRTAMLRGYKEGGRVPKNAELRPNTKPKSRSW